VRPAEGIKVFLLLFLQKKKTCSFLKKRTKRLLIPAVAALVIAGGYLASEPDLRRAQTVCLDVRDRAGQTLNVALARDGMWRLRTAPEEVDPAYLALLLHQEDRRFYAHAGVDPLALARAAAQLATHGHVVSGGSTLTMQVARLLAPHQHTAWGKLRDIAMALRLEAHLTKRDILALYLTLAPMGGNLEGVRAASLRYFGHAPDHLNAAEAALLVALPQSPAARRPDRHPAAAVAAASSVLRRAGLAPEAWRPALAPFPHLAPSLATHLAQAGMTGPVRTTLDGTLQREAEAVAAREAGWAGPGAQAACLIVRNSDRAVLAYVGGTNRHASGGQVDMVRAIRSPGSALKPFIYGLALDDGLIRPDTLIEDGKLRIADYAPQNFDRASHGTVTAATALQQSYNLPAVTVLDWVGAGRMAAALRGAGAHLAIPGGAAATLPLALGGAGMTLRDLAMLYAGLGNGGVVKPLRILAGDPPAAGVDLISGPAAGRVLNMLRGGPRPDGVSQGAETIPYKTGTSFGFRDAWAFGVTDHVTAGVWMGQADGTPRPGAFARETAAPLMFKLLDLLPAEDRIFSAPDSAEEMPAALRRLPARETAPLLAASRPHILYPPPDVLLSLPEDSDLSLEATGGKPPYLWAVNGVPLPRGANSRTARWRPDGPGFVHVSVTDKDGHSAQQDLRLR
jgi:penicillin-binding protein 1C